MKARTSSLPSPRPASVRFAELLALGALLAIAWRTCGASHRHRRLSRSACAPAEVHTWEGEGGRPLPVDHTHAARTTAAR